MSHKFYKETHALRNELWKLPRDKLILLSFIHEVALEVLGEYEHGTADIESLGLKSIKQYAAVLLDFMLSLSVFIEDH